MSLAPLRRTAAALLATGLVLAPALAATAATSATTVTDTDPRGDVQTQRTLSSAQKASIDLTSLKGELQGLGTRLTATVRTAGGAASSRSVYSVGFIISGSGNRSVQLILPSKQVLVAINGKARSCSGARGSRSNNTYVVSVPTSCVATATATSVHLAGVSSYQSRSGTAGFDFTDGTTGTLRIKR